MGKIRDEMRFQLIGCVVRPEHAHLLMSEPPRSTLSVALQKLKLRTARTLRKRRGPLLAAQMRPPFAAAQEPLRPLWQARFYDFNVYSRRKRREKLNYMHANPVKRGLVPHPKNLAHSSWRFYQGIESGSLHMDAA